MAKNMALIENSIVSNILWCADAQQETETLIDVKDRPVGIGDEYRAGKFYREGAEVRTALEQAQQELADARSALNVLGVME